MEKKKTATMAGILALGAGLVGAHQLYLKKNQKFAYIHIGLVAAGLILAIVSAVIDMSTQGSALKNMQTASLRAILSLFGYILIVGSAIWGAVDGVIILVKGEEGLRAVGLQLAAPASAAASTNGTDGATGAEAANGAVVAERKPMDPEKKKKIILFSAIGGGAVLVVGAIIAVIVILNHVNYHETYAAAKLLKDHVYNIQKDVNCEYVRTYANSDRVSEKTYNDYIYSCQQVLTTNNDLVPKLGETSAAQKDKGISNQFKIFQTEYEATIPSANVVTERLGLYKTWHEFVLARAKLTISQSTEKEYQTVANLLLESGNDELRKFGEEWLKLALAYRSAYKEYWGSSTAGEKEQAAMSDAKNAFYRFEEKSMPDIIDIAGLQLEGVSKMHSEFRQLYELIRTGYQDHYDGSGECKETIYGVICS